MSARVMSIGFLVLLLTSVVLAGDAKTPGPDLVKDSKTLHGKIESKVEEMLSHDGPWLLFGVIMLAGVGIPISEEILIVPAGFLIERGVLPFWSTVAAAWTGVVLADLIWMLLVRRFAHKLLSIRLFRRMFHPRRILEIKYMLDKWGAWVVVMGRILDPTEVRKIARRTDVALTTHRFDDPELPAAFKAALPSLADGKRIGVQPPDNRSVSGFALLQDIYGKPALVLRANPPRHIYDQGRRNTSHFL